MDKLMQCKWCSALHCGKMHDVLYLTLAVFWKHELQDTATSVN
jgi:hypothetical protein